MAVVGKRGHARLELLGDSVTGSTSEARSRWRSSSGEGAGSNGPLQASDVSRIFDKSPGK
jgi:hypothetical protein